MHFYFHFTSPGIKSTSTASYQVTISTNQSLPTAPSAINSQTKQSKGILRILQFNCNGVSGKAQNEIHIALFQQTKLKKQSRNPSLGPLFTIIRKDRPKEGGNLLIAIHGSIQYEEVSLNIDGTQEAMCISVAAGTSKLRISNFYIPPRSSCPLSYTTSLTDLLVPGDALVLGDVNVHSSLWNSNLEEDQHGQLLSNEMTESTYAP